MSGVPVATMLTLWNSGWKLVSVKQDLSVLSKFLCLQACRYALITHRDLHARRVRVGVMVRVGATVTL